MIVIFAFLLSKPSFGQGLGEFVAFLGLKNYTLGSIRSVSDSNIYLQENGIINENGRVQHIYHYKNLYLFPYELGGVKFTDILLFYESNKLTRIDISRAYVDRVEKHNNSLQNAELNRIYSFLTQLSGRKGRKHSISKSNFYMEKGYKWKKDDIIMQSKIHIGKTPEPTPILLISIKYKWY